MAAVSMETLIHNASMFHADAWTASTVSLFRESSQRDPKQHNAIPKGKMSLFWRRVFVWAPSLPN